MKGKRVEGPDGCKAPLLDYVCYGDGNLLLSSLAKIQRGQNYGDDSKLDQVNIYAA